MNTTMEELLDQARDILYAIEDEGAEEGGIAHDAWRVRCAIDLETEHRRETADPVP